MAKEKDIAVSKSKFEAFAKGVERLKELENELNLVDTRGFAREEASIRAKLKKVSEIPAIERELKALKQKIQHKFRPAKHHAARVQAKMQHELKEVSEELPKIEKSVRVLPKLEKDIEAMEKKYARVDEEVGLIVDTDVSNMLKDLKVAVSDRLKKKEHETDEIRMDLMKKEAQHRKRSEALEKSYCEHMEKLEKAYAKKYKKKLNTEMHKKIAADFKAALNKKFEHERNAVAVEVSKALAKKDTALKNKLHKSYVEKLKEHINDYEVELKKKKLDLELEVKEFK